MSSETFDLKILSEKLSKLNNSQQSIESLSRWCISHRKKARQVVETWEKTFNMSQKEQCISCLYLANDILQNSRKKGNEFVNEFWKVLPAALKHVYDNCDQSGKKAATRLVGIWEDRKVFGSRVQSLKDAVATEVKDLVPQVVSGGKSSNPIKIVKKDSQSLRIKLNVGGFPEKIISAFHSLHEECSNEDSALAKCDIAVVSAERVVTDVENSIREGIPPGSGTTDEMQEQEDILEDCVRQLEHAKATRVALISLLKDALLDQELKIGDLQDHLQVARRWIDDIEILRPKIPSPNAQNIPAASVDALNKPLILAEPMESMLQSSQPVGPPPVHLHQTLQPPGQPTTSFASLATNDEDGKKAAAAAVAAKLAASTSSAEMLSSVLSSLMAEQAAKLGFNHNLPMSPPEKRPKLEPSGPSSSNSVNAPQLPPLPPPHIQHPNQASNQYVQSAGMMLNMLPYGYGGNGLPPPPPPPPPHLAAGLPCPPGQQNPQPLQPPLQPSQSQNGSGGYYGPPGFGLYSSNSQPSPPPVQRHS